MMGKRSPQARIFAADRLYLDYVGRDTLYGYLAEHREQLFRDEDFAALYCPDNGRTSVPPSLALSMLFLRAYEGVSFVEAVEQTKYDLRWKVALGLEVEEVPMQKSSLQEFEARLVLHEMGEPLLKKSIEEARRAGYLPNRKIRVALDTTPILGKGAVKDTYNLLAEGIEKLARGLAEVEGEEVKAWAEGQGLSRYFGSSLKGEAAIDWDDKAQRQGLLTQIVEDGRYLLRVAEKLKEQHAEQGEGIEAAAALLRRLIAQDVEEKPGGGCQVKSGTAKDRVVSVHDPEMRHGRKSASKRFNGHKAALAVEMESQLISGVEVLAGNAGDQEKALPLVEQSERVMEAEVEETVGDCAYGGGPTRRAFAEAERPLTAKVPVSQNGDRFPKSEFEVDLERREVRCPGGQISSDYQSDGPGRGGRFIFPAATCQACPLRSQCLKGRGPRSISIQAEEGLQQQARLHNQTEAGRKSLRERVVVEHRIARLVGLGIRKSRYFGRKKTCFQVVMAAVMANLSLVVGFCRGQAQQVGGVAEKAAAQLANCFFPAVLTLWDRYFGWARPVRV
ncbi:MAG TPA: IS1182 family transposase [Candidatus Acidoferrum sp.]|nr:IS1182 family transposase [Candidatus Acidoferrum sp.]